MIKHTDFMPVFESMPGNNLLVYPHSSHFTIIAASKAYARATFKRTNTLLEREMFDVFPDNPEDPHANGVENLSASFYQVRKKGEPHKMKLQRYDVRDENNVFVTKYWDPLNTPVIDELGKLKYIIHQVKDVTLRIKLQQFCNQIIDEPDYNEFSQSDFLMCNPVGIMIFKGSRLVVEFANELALRLWRKKVSNVIGKPALWALSRTPGNNYFDFHLMKVFTSGKSCYLEQMPIRFFNVSDMQTTFVNCWIDVTTADDGSITGVIAVISEITESENK